MVALAHGDDDFLLLLVVPSVTGFQKLREVALIDAQSREQLGVYCLAVDELEFVFLDWLAVVVSGFLGFLLIFLGGLEVKAACGYVVGLGEQFGHLVSSS